MWGRMDKDRLSALKEAAFRREFSNPDSVVKAVGQGDREHPGVREVLAIVKHQTGDQTGAAALIEALPADWSCDSRSLALLLRTQFKANAGQQALETAQRILALDPRHVEALGTTARIYNRQSNWSKADICWRRLAEVGPGQSEALLQVARIATRNKTWDTAKIYADMYLRAVPGHAEVLGIAIDCRQRLQNLTGIEALLVRLYAVQPERALQFLLRLNAERYTELYARVISEFAKIDPQNAELAKTRDQLVKQWVAVALRLELEKSDEKAAEFYRSIRAIMPDSRDATLGIRRLYRPAIVSMREAQKRDDKDAAIRSAEDVLKVDPDMD